MFSDTTIRSILRFTWMFYILQGRKWVPVVHDIYAGTSLSCAGIQRWKSASFHWTAKNLVGESRRRMTPHPLPTPPLNGHPELVRWAMRRRRKMTPTPYPPTPKWSSRVGEMSNEEEEEDDPHPLPTHPQMVIQSWWDEQWGGGGRWPPPPTHPTPNGPHCEEFHISDNMCISCSLAVHTLYCSAGILRPRGFGEFATMKMALIVHQSAFHTYLQN